MLLPDTGTYTIRVRGAGCYVMKTKAKFPTVKVKAPKDAAIVGPPYYEDYPFDAIAGCTVAGKADFIDAPGFIEVHDPLGVLSTRSFNKAVRVTGECYIRVGTFGADSAFKLQFGVAYQKIKDKLNE